MQYSQEHLKTMVYAEFGGQTECIMGNWKIENYRFELISLEILFLEKWFDQHLTSMDKEKIWVPDRNWAYDLQHTGRML